MSATGFKHKHLYQQQHQHQQFNKSNNNNNDDGMASHQNHKNQNSIFILNTATNNILPNNPQLYYSDLNDNNVVSLLTPTFAPSTKTKPSSSSSSSSVWSSASSTVCSPAAHAIQKLFSCSSSSLKLNQANYSGIESKKFKTKSEILKKKSKFWKYLEGEANDKNHKRGIEIEKKTSNKSFQYKTKCWSKSNEQDNQKEQDLAELLEYSCSLCDNCRCMDCQIGYFDYDNSDDSNSEYSFHLSSYDEDEDLEDSDNDNDNDNENLLQQPVKLKTSKDVGEHSYPGLNNDNKNDMQKLIEDRKDLTDYSQLYCVCNEVNCNSVDCCQQCSNDCSIGCDAKQQVKHFAEDDQHHH